MKVTVISHQFKKVAPAMRSSSAGKIVPAQLILSAWSLAMFSGHPDAWQGAVDVLTGNSVNLMNAIKELLKATEATSKVSASSKGESMLLYTTFIHFLTGRCLPEVSEPD